MKKSIRNKRSAGGFIVDEMGPSGVFGVFEDDGETGWLYLYEPARAGNEGDADAILHARHVYNRSETCAPAEGDVAVLWTDDLTRCGVVVWAKMRAIIDVDSRRDHAAALKDRKSQGIVDAEWLRGFSSYKRPTNDDA
jgi:hypothetical protein